MSCDRGLGQILKGVLAKYLDDTVVRSWVTVNLPHRGTIGNQKTASVSLAAQEYDHRDKWKAALVTTAFLVLPG